jgi:hypothetical protein
MSDYLDRLERELTEAVDRQAAGAKPPLRGRIRRRGLRPLGAVALVAVVVVAVALVATHEDRTVAPPAPPTAPS